MLSLSYTLLHSNEKGGELVAGDITIHFNFCYRRCDLPPHLWTARQKRKVVQWAKSPRNCHSKGFLFKIKKSTLCQGCFFLVTGLLSILPTWIIACLNMVSNILKDLLITLNFVTAIFRDFVTSLYSIFGGDFVMLTKDKQAALSLLR